MALRTRLPQRRRPGGSGRVRRRAAATLARPLGVPTWARQLTASGQQARRTASNPVWRNLIAVVLVDSAGLLPPIVLGLNSAALSADAGVSAGLVGLLVACFFGSGSLTAICAGPWGDRVGPRTAAITASLALVVAAVAIAVAGGRFPVLVLAMVVSGAGFSVATPATNAMLGRIAGPTRTTLATASKQAAIPAALVVASAVLPGITSQWRAQSGVIALLGVLNLLLLISLPRANRPAPTGSVPPRGGRAAQRGVLVVGAATLLASFLPGSLIGFAADSLTGAGLELRTAALLVAAANAVGIAARIASGLLVHRGVIGEAALAALMMTLGGGGAFLLASDEVGWMVPGVFLAYAMGWGWSGLVYAMVLGRNPQHAAATGAVVHSGGLLGSALGPAVMTAFAVRGSAGGGWLAGGGLAIVGAAVAWRARRGGQIPESG